MIRLTSTAMFSEGDPVLLDPFSIESISFNEATKGSCIRMRSGERWLVAERVEDVGDSIAAAKAETMIPMQIPHCGAPEFPGEFVDSSSYAPVFWEYHCPCGVTLPTKRN